LRLVFAMWEKMRTFATEKQERLTGMNILCISRSLRFSPNLAGEDAAIFTAVVDELRAMSHRVTTLREEKMTEMDFAPFDRVMTMARDIPSLVMLEQMMDTETQRKFINNIGGMLACTNKAKVAALMMEEGVPQPEFVAGKQDEVLFCSPGAKEGINIPAWLKNCDGSATKAEDTLFCDKPKPYRDAKKLFRKMGVETWLLQEHRVGDLVKFYGVEGTDFFHWQYASMRHSKFGLEKINGRPRGYDFDVQHVKHYADKLASRMGVPVYGGDVIISLGGKLHFIDFNDFPSFSSCRDMAAKAIAKRITQ